MSLKVIKPEEAEPKKEKQEEVDLDQMETKKILKLILDGQNEMKTDISGLKEGQVRIENDVAGLKTDVSSLKKGQARLENDVAGLKTDVSSLKEGQARLEQRQEKLEEGQARLEQRQEKLEQRQANLEQKQTNLEQKVDSIDNSVKTIEGEFIPNFKALTEAFVMHTEQHEEKEKEWKQTMNEIHEMYATMNHHIAKEEMKNKTVEKK